MDTRSLITKTIDEMIGRGESLSIHAVAGRCGVSHSLIYNRYPDLKELIKELKAVQRAKIKAGSDEDLIAKLIAKNKTLLRRINDGDSARHAPALKGLLTHVQEVYSMYDQLLEDRNKLAARLLRKG